MDTKKLTGGYEHSQQLDYPVFGHHGLCSPTEMITPEEKQMLGIYCIHLSPQYHSFIQHKIPLNQHKHQ